MVRIKEVKMDIVELWPVLFLIFAMFILGTIGWIEIFGVLLGVEEVFAYLLNAF